MNISFGPKTIPLSHIGPTIETINNKCIWLDGRAVRSLGLQCLLPEMEVNSSIAQLEPGVVAESQVLYAEGECLN